MFAKLSLVPRCTLWSARRRTGQYRFCAAAVSKSARSTVPFEPTVLNGSVPPFKGPCVVPGMQDVIEDLIQVGFGKYKEKRYSDLLVQDPEYCRWVMKAAKESDNPRMLRFGAWLDRRMPPVISDEEIAAFSGESEFVATSESVVEFGMFKGVTFSEMLANEPDYCHWVVESSKRDHPLRALKQFAIWLRDRLPSERPAKSNEKETNMIKFGKYYGRSYDEILKGDQDYCEWVVTNDQSNQQGDSNLPTRRFAKWLEDKLIPTLRFGKHRGKTFEEILQIDQEYCKWIWSQHSTETSDQLKSFCAWLSKRAPETFPPFPESKGNPAHQVP